MKLELKFSTWSEFNRSIFEGSGPHKPSDTRDSILQACDDWIRDVKSASMEKLSERVWLGSGGFFLVVIWEGDVLLPMTVNSVT